MKRWSDDSLWIMQTLNRLRKHGTVYDECQTMYFCDGAIAADNGLSRKAAIQEAHDLSNDYRRRKATAVRRGTAGPGSGWDEVDVDDFNNAYMAGYNMCIAMQRKGAKCGTDG